jgi:hypothetical protein
LSTAALAADVWAIIGIPLEKSAVMFTMEPFPFFSKCWL